MTSLACRRAWPSEFPSNRDHRQQTTAAPVDQSLLSRGGDLLTVTGVPAEVEERALDVFDDAGAVDIDERECAWRAEG